ncbi:MAG: 4Fe-4S dicluster domain-containing protein [bacterium]|nr:MAG: 4Fe-4S dicluster domain-containing protein [bacterium]
MARWGMVIDLNKCTGCAECVTACKVENNVAVVGKDESEMGRTMLWMDILTHYEGEYPNTKVRYLPRPCLQCDNPPCTKVCPVRATYLDPEGIVAQIFPQCIGCRYCMAACPYTVKSFNWYEPHWPQEMAAALNPDVSARPAGVVEKCTFCVHRLQKAKEQADSENRELQDNEYIPACAEDCPTQAISFGDLDSPHSEVSELIRSPRIFTLLEELGTEPKVYYLSEIE